METHQRRYALWALLAGTPRGFTLRELAERFGVAKNTIHRDLDRLSHVGAGITEELRGQTMRFRAHAGPPSAELTEDEKLALQASESCFVPWIGGSTSDLTSALAKVGVGVGAGVRLDIKGPVANVRADPAVVKTLIAGMRERRSCAIRYLRRGTRKPRPLKVEPLRIVAATGLLYIRAIVRPRGVAVTLALHLVKACELLDERFTRTSNDDDSTAFGATDDEPQHVVVRFHPDIALFIEDRVWHPSQRLSRDADGALRFEATLGGMHEFVGWVMSWGGRAELVSPVVWRSEVISRAKAIVAGAGSI